jgi:hypothetical protein
MLLRLFRGTGPGTIFLIIVTLLIIWSGAFFKLQDHFSLYFDQVPMPLYGILLKLIGTNAIPLVIFTLVLVSYMCILLVSFNTTLFFITERTFVPALIYILLSGFFTQYQLLNPAIFGAIFMMMTIMRIMGSFRIQGTAFSFFDAGILIGTGSLFYANLIWFGMIVFIGIALLRTVNIKEIVISVIGLVTPYILTFGIYFVLGYDLKDLIYSLDYNLFTRHNDFALTGLTIATLILAGLVTLVSIIHLLIAMNNKKIQSRKTFNLLLWIFIISILVYILSTAVSVEILWITGIPVSYFLTHYFVLFKKKLLPEILFSVLFLLILLIRILYLK